VGIDPVGNTLEGRVSVVVDTLVAVPVKVPKLLGTEVSVESLLVGKLRCACAKAATASKMESPNIATSSRIRPPFASPNGGEAK